MFNKKKLIIFILCIIVFGFSYSLNGKEYNVLTLLNINNRLMFFLFQLLLLSVLVITFIILCYQYKRITVNFYKSLIEEDYKHAEEIIKKYYKQNKMLFSYQYLCLVFAKKDEETLKDFYQKSKSNSKNFIICETYYIY